jgi:hypothetical protein
MRALLAMTAVVSLLGAVACGPRKVEVNTGPQPQSTASLTVTNNTTQQVNVYVVTGGTEVFVGEVDPNSTRALSVSGVAAGSVVSLVARPVGGTGGWRRDDVSLSGNTTWSVP